MKKLCKRRTTSRLKPPLVVSSYSSYSSSSYSSSSYSCSLSCYPRNWFKHVSKTRSYNTTNWIGDGDNQKGGMSENDKCLLYDWQKIRPVTLHQTSEILSPQNDRNDEMKKLGLKNKSFLCMDCLERRRIGRFRNEF